MNKKDLQAFKVVTCCHNRQKTWLYKVLIQHMGVSIAYVIVPSTPVTQTADSVGLVRQSSFRRAGYFRLLVWTYLSLSPQTRNHFPFGAGFCQILKFGVGVILEFFTNIVIYGATV